jgi:hypothetical protein
LLTARTAFGMAGLKTVHYPGEEGLLAARTAFEMT